MQKIRYFTAFCVILFCITLFYSVSFADTYTLDNDGYAMESPWGKCESIPPSFDNCEYYDCYLPYNMEINDIGGYVARGTVNPTAGTENIINRVKYDIVEDNPNKRYAKVTYHLAHQSNQEYAAGDGERVKKAFWNGPDLTVDREFIRNGYDKDTGCMVVTDAEGTKYYVMAIQEFFYRPTNTAGDPNGMEPMGSIENPENFPKWGTMRGQVVDVILTDGTVIHFIVADANSSKHTNTDGFPNGPNGGEYVRTDDHEHVGMEVHYADIPDDLVQYEHMFSHTNVNCIELWGDKVTDDYAIVRLFREKYNITNDEGGVRIALYRMYNFKAVQMGSNGIKRSSSVPEGVSYNLDVDIAKNARKGTVRGSDGSIYYLQDELPGLEFLNKKLDDPNKEIRLPYRYDISGEGLFENLVKIESDIQDRESITFIDRVRFALILVGIILIFYSVMLAVAAIIDRTFGLQISLVYILTFTFIKFDRGWNNTTAAGGYKGIKYVVSVCTVLLILGLILLSGGMWDVVIKIIRFIN